ncbi:transcriptional regulator [Ochrobactrum sp. MYb15]|nr:transcriptional regulator [Brucella pituitosa]PQZ47694.1 transcriptional regulator [Ochrobactrum sp. MYb19]PRA53109.1 transcriptional regulator [Ochrobactrum sp. MYb68]PRA63371.1 transcriptional regulator [Ochrobactrum sp. MYb18]PRA73274.1 transcriptional regulator [Brucella thiophenivorans]PRA83752.1 transcriptional regulator [Ochrobactrum sp. MYb29]PRA88365.1 transcriptional regulator [Ochrobactrum sp. MYb14]PRA94797.1 transcriptional regulator [Ochrobactrum sp. MYb15]
MIEFNFISGDIGMANENLTATENQVTEKVQDSPKATKSKAKTPSKRVKAKVEETPIIKAESSKVVRRSPAERARLLAAVTKQIQSGKTTVKAALKEAGVSEQTYYNWKNQAKENTPVVSHQSDELKNLVELEAENKRLRKELAEKLRTENAELRKRLGLV